MENDNKIVMDEITENVDTTTTEQIVEDGEQVETPSAETLPEKIYSEAEFQARVKESMDKKVPRMEAKIRKQYDDEYGRLISVLQAGTGEKDVSKITAAFEKYYGDKGVDTSPKKPEYSQKDEAILARADADEIISLGTDEVNEEVDRLAKIGLENMTARDKAVFGILANHRENAERSKKFAELGVTEEVYNSQEFKEFASMFTKDTSLEKIVNLYSKNTQPKKELKTAGSLTNTSADDGGVKDYYSPEEAAKFTVDDFNKNPLLYKRVCESMQKWK